MHPRELYDKTAESYDLRHSSPTMLEVRKKERDLIERFSTGKVLDFGCGTGCHLQPGHTGLDISGKMLALARGKAALARKGVALVHGAEALPFKSSSFDTIHCFMTVLNLVEPSVVQEFSRVLRPGGRVLLSASSVFENPGSPEKVMRISGCKLIIKLFTKQEVEKLFSGYKLLHFSSLYRSFTPVWGSFHPFTPEQKNLLRREHTQPEEQGRIYFFMFQNNPWVQEK